MKNLPLWIPIALMITSVSSLVLYFIFNRIGTISITILGIKFIGYSAIKYHSMMHYYNMKSSITDKRISSGIAFELYKLYFLERRENSEIIEISTKKGIPVDLTTEIIKYFEQNKTTELLN